ncbi:MAG: NUDIX hydrolase [Rhodospirillales bacterium]|nr:NUDIX hydrolase [Rhodospirillales bacterium]
MTDQPSRPTRHTFEKTRRLLDDFFKVDEYHGTCEQFDGTMGPPHRLLVFERGDSVAALLYDPARKEVILVDQFRLPVALRAGGQFGWLLEPTAGIQPATEDVFQTAMREIREETGYQVSSLTPIATFFPSPGGSTERIHLLFAEVRQIQQVETGGGIAQTGENIAVRRMRLTEFFSRLRNREFEDAKLIIGGYWSTYWFNGNIYGSEISRGIDVFRLVPSQYLSKNEIDAARADEIKRTRLETVQKMTRHAV